MIKFVISAVLGGSLAVAAAEEPGRSELLRIFCETELTSVLNTPDSRESWAQVLRFENALNDINDEVPVTVAEGLKSAAFDEFARTGASPRINGAPIYFRAGYNNLPLKPEMRAAEIEVFSRDAAEHDPDYQERLLAFIAVTTRPFYHWAEHHYGRDLPPLRLSSEVGVTNRAADDHVARRFVSTSYAQGHLIVAIGIDVPREHAAAYVEDFTRLVRIQTRAQTLVRVPIFEGHYH